MRSHTQHLISLVGGGGRMRLHTQHLLGQRCGEVARVRALPGPSSHCRAQQAVVG